MKCYSFTTQEVLDILSTNGVKPSAQRMIILRFLMENRIHPTVEEIYKALQPENPTLSRTTVYNTLRLLAEATIIRCIETGINGARWDYSQHDHAHFLCTVCGRVTDVDFTMPASLPMPAPGYRVHSADVIFRGTCPECAARASQATAV